jgi:two-component system cell cycle response regulator DivK
MFTSSETRKIPVARPISGREPQKASSDLLAPLILLVDDRSEDIALYGGHLLAAGYRVATATTGGDAVALALYLVPDLVVMDLEMPGIEGWEATRLLRSHQQTAHIPVIALSGFHSTAMVMRAIVAGCSGFVPKPCLAEKLEAAIRSTLESVRMKNSASEAAI